MKVNNKPMREKVVELCRKDPSLVDDDTRLIANVWWQEGWKDKKLCERLKSVSSPETVRRTRQKLVEEGVLKPLSCYPNRSQTRGKESSQLTWILTFITIWAIMGEYNIKRKDYHRISIN